MRQYYLSAILISLFVAMPLTVSGDAPAAPDLTTYELRYKLSIGEVLRYEVMHRASVRSTIDETTQAAQTMTDSVKSWNVTDVLPNGEIEIMNVVERVRMVNQLPGHDPAEYDSELDETPPPGFEDAAKSIGVPLSVVRISPSGEIVQRVSKIRQQNVEEDAPIVVRLPDKPVTIGATWDEPFDVKVTLENGDAKTVQTRRHHKLTAVATGIATIEVTYQVLTPINPYVESQLVQRLMDGEVKFDIKAGRVVSQKMDIDKRILGFAGPTSSMHYIVRMEEKLLGDKPKVAAKQPSTTQPAAKPSPRPPAEASRTSPKRQQRTSRTSSRSRAPIGTKGYRR
jgi:hypothetical protein